MKMIAYAASALVVLLALLATLAVLTCRSAAIPTEFHAVFTAWQAKDAASKLGLIIEAHHTDHYRFASPNEQSRFVRRYITYTPVGLVAQEWWLLDWFLIAEQKQSSVPQ